MSYIKIEKEKLVNLEYALSKELLRSNRGGSYAGTTISGCNTRKYHGLLVSRLDDGQKHVLLSSLDETVIQMGKEFRLGIHQYKDDIYFPHGHRYLIGFESEPIPSNTYRVGGVILQKNLLLTEEDDGILIKYTILDAHSPTKIRLQPLLAFRNMHSLSKENLDVNYKTKDVQNGIQVKLYEHYPPLYMQTSKAGKFITAPDWNKNILYQEEKNRGYDYVEDLFTHGYFELNVKKGDSVIFYAGLKELKTAGLKRKFTAEVNKRTPRSSFYHNLTNSAQQFITKNKKDISITTGFHWYDSHLRESLISLTGLTLYNGNKLFDQLFDSILKKFEKTEPSEITPDIPLLIIRALQEKVGFAENCEEIWKKHKTSLLKLLRNLKAGLYNAELHENGLLFIPDEKETYTWMNEIADGKAVTPRTGFVVEVNALWYNALLYLSGVADINNSQTLKKELENLPEKAAHFFNEVFVQEGNDHLYDFVNNEEQNADIRPNQIFAASLPYSPLSDRSKKYILKNIKSHLLTDKGLRTLSPNEFHYIGKYFGNENQRNAARHQGTVHPWLIFEFCAAWLNLYKEQGLDFVEKIYSKFENEMHTYGLGTISELYDGNPPHKPNGAVSYAPSVSALLKLKALIDSFKESIE
jgi:predicted glycogen debranching enzyme